MDVFLMINNSSGHYQPPVEFAEQVIQHLVSQGADMSMVTIEMIQ